MKTMLILRGNSGTYDGHAYPHGAIDQEAAAGYAEARGYVAKFVHASYTGGFTGPRSDQTNRALREYDNNPTIRALYGFSGGGYNVRWILARLTDKEAERIELVVVLGAPNAPRHLYAEGDWELVWRADPPEGHMAGPRVLLKDWLDNVEAKP